MYAIVATYRPATDTRGARFTVRAGTCRATVSYDYAARDAGHAAILEAVRTVPAFEPWSRLRLAFGTLPDGATVAVAI